MIYILDALTQIPRRVVLGMSIGLMIVLLFADRYTGPDISLSLFYLLPIGLITWHSGRTPGFTLMTVSVVLWVLLETWRQTLPYTWTIIVWNALIRLAVFAIIIWLLNELRHLLAREQYLARTDPLTGVWNRRWFYDLVLMECRRARRYRMAMALVYLDLDNFKLVNDTFGHQVGDQVLQIVAQTLRQHLRITDQVARLGGDEFGVLLIQTDQEEAVQATLMRVQLALDQEMQARGWPTTCSMGVALFHWPPDDIDQVLQAADQILYAAKIGGKHQVLVRVIASRTE